MEHTDYSNPQNWIALGGRRDKPVDVFHVIPTSWYGTGDEILSSIDDPHYAEQARFNVDFQASVFETEANIYAPHYRQLEPRYCISLSPERRFAAESREPRQDVFDALDYYFEYYNRGKPFILSGHSQGSILLLHVLSEYMSAYPDRYARMVAAYVIGYSVTRDYLGANKHLRFAEGERDTGVIISYNTEAPEHEGKSPVLLCGAQAINPISWRRDFEIAGASESRGSLIKGRELPHYADARIDPARGCVICSTAQPCRLCSTLFPAGIYHIHDYGLYYFDLRHNARVRLEAFLTK